MGGVDPSDYLAEVDRLVAKVRDLGATDEEIRVATERGSLGPLALDLSTRGAGPVRTLAEFANEEGMDLGLARRMWTALGLPLEGPVPLPVTEAMAEALRLLGGMVMLLGEEALLALARVVGQSVARQAEALSDAFRVGSEVPMLSAGVSYADVVDGYTAFTRDALPLFLGAVGAVFQRHLVLVSHQGWTADEDAAAVTRQRTVGFADLVGSTEVLHATSVAELAALVGSFESLAWEVVTQRGGRVVKLIGDEAMFVFEDPEAACAAALALAERSPHPVRVGLAHGAVVGMHGDYYGRIVNLAARLVRAAPPGAAVVTDAVRTAAPSFAFDPVDLGPLKGFPDAVAAYRLAGAT
jgi:adenylate cyclase